MLTDVAMQRGPSSVALLCEALAAVELGEIHGGSSRIEAGFELIEEQLRLHAKQHRHPTQLCEEVAGKRYRSARAAFLLVKQHKHIEAVNIIIVPGKFHIHDGCALGADRAHTGRFHDEQYSGL